MIPGLRMKKTVETQLENQVDIGSAQHINSPEYIIAHQTADRIGFPNKANNVAVFNNLDVRKYLVDIDGVRHPRDGVSIDYGLDDYVDQYSDIKFFRKSMLVKNY